MKQCFYRRVEGFIAGKSFRGSKMSKLLLINLESDSSIHLIRGDEASNSTQMISR